MVMVSYENGQLEKEKKALCDLQAHQMVLSATPIVLQNQIR